jgi:hypothetical protein
MRAGIRPSEFWDLTPVEYNLIVEAYGESQKEFMYRDIRNAYYTGCFAQIEKPSEFYDKIVGSLSSSSQSAEEMFEFLKGIAKGGTQDEALDSRFRIPLKLTPEFDVGVFSYIYSMEEDTLKLHLPDVALSLDGVVLAPVKNVYSIRPGIVNIKYSGQVYTIVIIRA